LVIEKVLSCTSSGFSFFERARSARSFMVRWISEDVFLVGIFHYGTSSPQSSATAMPMFDLLVKDDVGSIERSVQRREARRPATAAFTKKGMNVSFVS